MNHASYSSHNANTHNVNNALKEQNTIKKITLNQKENKRHIKWVFNECSFGTHSDGESLQSPVKRFN